MPNWKKLITSGSDALLNKLNVTNGITGSLFGSASWSNNSLTASYVTTLNQNVLITGSLTIGSTTLGSNENTLVLGPSPAGGVGEGGQILLQAPGGTYTSASMWDNYTNKTRLLRGTNASSDAEVATWNMHSKQMQLPAYNSLGAFTGTPVAALGVNSNGDVITIQTGSQAGGSGVTITNNTDNYILTATGTANTINGESGLTYNGSTLAVTGNVTATSFTGSLQGTATSATNATNATNAQNINVKSGPGSAKWYVPFINGLDVYAQPYGAESFKFDSSIGLAEVTSSYALSASLVATIRDTTSNTFYPTLVNSDNSPASYEQLYTTNNISIRPGLGLISATAISATALTGSLLGTSSFATTALTASFITASNVYGPYGSNSILSASYALTASYALNAGTGGTPSGAQYSIQYNSGSNNFGGSPNFTYEPHDSSITFIATNDIGSTPIYNNGINAVRLTHSSSSIAPDVFHTELVHRSKLLPLASTTDIISFTMNGGANTSLRVISFKCDYTIVRRDGSNVNTDSRVGTLLGAWQYDNGTSNISDSSIDIDASGQLPLIIFGFSYNGSDIILQADTSQLGFDCVFIGLFTIFTAK